MRQMIEIEQQEDNTYRLSVKTEGGQILIRSKAIKSKGKVEKMADLLLAPGQARLVFERKTNHQGKFLYNIKDSGGELLGISELYNSEAGMENGIKNLKIRLAVL